MIKRSIQENHIEKIGPAMPTMFRLVPKTHESIHNHVFTTSLHGSCVYNIVVFILFGDQLPKGHVYQPRLN